MPVYKKQKKNNFDYSKSGDPLSKKTKITILYKASSYNSKPIGNHIYVDDVESFVKTIKKEFDKMLISFHEKFRPHIADILNYKPEFKDEAKIYEQKFPNSEFDFFPTWKYLKIQNENNIPFNCMPVVSFYGIHIPFVTLYFATSFSMNFKIKIEECEDNDSSFYLKSIYWKNPHKVYFIWPKEDDIEDKINLKNIINERTNIENKNVKTDTNKKRKRE